MSPPGLVTWAHVRAAPATGTGVLHRVEGGGGAKASAPKGSSSSRSPAVEHGARHPLRRDVQQRRGRVETRTRWPRAARRAVARTRRRSPRAAAWCRARTQPPQDRFVEGRAHRLVVVRPVTCARSPQLGLYCPCSHRRSPSCPWRGGRQPRGRPAAAGRRRPGAIRSPSSGGSRARRIGRNTQATTGLPGRLGAAGGGWAGGGADGWVRIRNRARNPVPGRGQSPGRG